MVEKPGAHGLSLRKGNIADTEAIHALDHKIFPPGVCYDLTTFYFHLVDPDSFTFIAEMGGELIGFVIYRTETDKFGTIVTIDVDPVYQNIGVGSVLMGVVEKVAAHNGLKSIMLQVSVDNESAKRFYAKRGYTKRKLLKSYYRKGEDAWEMWLRL